MHYRNSVLLELLFNYGFGTNNCLFSFMVEHLVYCHGNKTCFKKTLSFLLTQKDVLLHV